MSFIQSVPLSFNRFETQEQNSKKKSNKIHVSAACVNCKKAHLACDVARPCQRCINTDKTDTCRDVQHKKRGRPKMMRDSNNNKIRSIPSVSNNKNYRVISFPSEPMASASNDSMIIILTMDLCCARVTDKSFEYLELYPQEFSHRSIYDFLLPESQKNMSKLHRCLLDNVSQHQQKKLPMDTVRSSSDLFFSLPIQTLISIANGSFTLKKELLFQCGGELKRIGNMNCQFYLGGGLGADLFDSNSIHQLYIVCILSPVSCSSTSSSLEAVINTPLSTPIPPLLLNDQVISPATTHYSLLEEDQFNDDNDINDDDNTLESTKLRISLMSTQTKKPTLISTLEKPTTSTELDRLRSQCKRVWIHPHELYYRNTLSSRLSGDAIAYTTQNYLTTPSPIGSSSLATYNKKRKSN